MTERQSDDDIVIEDMCKSAAERTISGLEAMARAMRDGNSRMPATAEFLRERGLTHIDQLNDEGRRQLLTYLQQYFRRLQEAQRRGI